MAIAIWLSTGLLATAVMVGPGETLRSSEMPDTYNVMDFGAKGDGTTDDAGAFQAAIDAAAEHGGTVVVPARTFLLGRSITLHTGVALVGTWAMPHHGLEKNTMLLATHGHGGESGPALFEMQPSSCLRGFSVYYPEQDPNDIVPYPWTIHAHGMHATIEDLTLVNPYNAICIGPEWNELHLIRNVFGCPLRRGILVDYTTDIGRIENVHFNIHYWHRAQMPGGPGGESPTEPYRVWVQENLEAFIFGRSDWESLKDTFVYGAHTGYRFLDRGRGATNASLLGCGADACIYGLRVETIQPMGLTITNGQFAAFRHPEMPAQTDNPPVTNIYTTDTFSGNLSLVNCSFWGGNAIGHLRGLSEGHVRFTDCNYRDWHVYHPERYAIDIDGPSLLVRGCTFATHGLDVRIGRSTPAALVVDNLMAGGAEIDVASATEKIVVERNIVP